MYVCMYVCLSFDYCCLACVLVVCFVTLCCGRGGKHSAAVVDAQMWSAGLQVVFLRKKKTEIWPDLVASPTVFNKVLKKMGVSRFTFVDVFDPESIPSSAVVCAARLFWFPFGGCGVG